MATTLRLSPVTSPKSVCSQLDHSLVVLPPSNFSRELLESGYSSWNMSSDSSSSSTSLTNSNLSSASCGSPMEGHDHLQIEEIPNSISKSCSSIKEEMEVKGSSNDLDTNNIAKEDHISDFVIDELSESGINSICSMKLEDSVSELPKEEASEELNFELGSNSFVSHEKNPSSCYDESGESAKVSNSGDFVESGKSSICRGSTSSDVSEDSNSSSISNAMNKPHRANDSRCEAMQVIRSQDGYLGLNHFRILKRLGGGDIGTVYLSELTGTRTYFAMKVMDKVALASRKKLVRAQTEREILQTLDHPFLPTLYTHFETEKFSCLVMEFCPGGDLHALRQRQPGKRFSEHAARFYVAEVLLALEYLHMLGIIYRDLKPENVLVRDDGHIMLSDFDLSLTCAVCPTLVRSSKSTYFSQPDSGDASCVIQPSCIQPTCFMPRFLSRKSKKDKKDKPKSEAFHQVTARPELIAEPTDARSMSFVGTHEYLAPEIIKGEGHGSAVDWWMFGIFLFELLYGVTPFKGGGNRATLLNVVGQPLRFPESPSVSFAARDLIRGLLVKDPQQRLAHRRGATEIRQHPFFQSVNWALIRSTSPPEVPKPFITEMPKAPKQDNVPVVDVKPSGNYLDIDFF